MARDFLFQLANQPGTGAQAMSALGNAGINVIGVAAVGGGSIVHLAVEDTDATRARQALAGAGVSIHNERDVSVVPVGDHPGAAAALLQQIANAGVNLEFVYLATNTRVVLGADNPQALQQALSGA